MYRVWVIRHLQYGLIVCPKSGIEYIQFDRRTHSGAKSGLAGEDGVLYRNA